MTPIPFQVVSQPGIPTIHRFFDTSPFSPSGRYLGLTQFPFDDRLPTPGDEASILVVDLQTGETAEVDRTVAWDTQLGAQVQWGRSDRELIYNTGELNPARVHARVRDPATGHFRDLAGPVYMMNQEGDRALSPNLLKMNQVQKGYGVFWAGKKEWQLAVSDPCDGLWITELDDGRCRRLLSVESILEQFPRLRVYEREHEGRYVCFHVKWNPDGSRIFVVFRFANRERTFIRNSILTINADGSNLQMALDPEDWKQGGHHPNWCPDGERIMMNLRLKQAFLQLVSFRPDGSDLKILSESLPGTGHPTMHPDRRHILTDTYPKENRNRSWVPLRWLDLSRHTEQTLVEIPCVPNFTGPAQELRIDPHPAWDPSFSKVAFNCLSNGTRAVAIADLSHLVDHQD